MDHFASSVIRYCLQLARQGQWHELSEIGLGQPEIRMLMGMSLEGLITLERCLQRHGHPIRVRIDRAALRRALEDCTRAADADPVRLRLLELGAPAILMRQLYGMSEREYARLRMALGLSAPVGRPQEPDEETMDRISRAWDATGLSDPGLLGPEGWIQLAETAGVDVRTAHRVICRWFQRGADTAPTPATSDPSAPRPACLRRRRGG